MCKARRVTVVCRTSGRPAESALFRGRYHSAKVAEIALHLKPIVYAILFETAADPKCLGS